MGKQYHQHYLLYKVWCDRSQNVLLMFLVVLGEWFSSKNLTR